MTKATKSTMPTKKEQLNNLSSLLESKKAAIEQFASKHLSAERLIKLAQLAGSRQPLLLQCSPASLINSVITCGQLGLEPGGPSQEVALVPFRNTTRSKYEYECTVIPMFRGLQKLVRRTGKIDTIEARPVYENDKFKLDYGQDNPLTHSPVLSGDKGTLIGFYCRATFTGTNRCQVEWLDYADMQKIKRSAKSQQGPWKDWEEEMGRKTVMRRAAKWLPSSNELATAMELQANAEDGAPVDFGALLGDDAVPEAETEPRTVKPVVEPATASKETNDGPPPDVSVPPDGQPPKPGSDQDLFGK